MLRSLLACLALLGGARVGRPSAIAEAFSFDFPYDAGSYYWTEDEYSESSSWLEDYPGSYLWLDDYSYAFSGCSEAGGAEVLIGNGYCEVFNSNEACGYDGGDCCACTCVDSALHTCGENGYYCVDPSVSLACEEASTVYEPTPTGPSDEFSYCMEAGGLALYLGDGFCDAANNVEECGYDGGDCCACTCVDTTVFACGGGGYLCEDPSVPDACVEESEAYTPPSPGGPAPSVPGTSSLSPVEAPGCFEAGGFIPFVGDAFCDLGNNNEACGFDGGDCCSCTCESTKYIACGQDGYACVDPEASFDCLEDSLLNPKASDTVDSFEI